MRSPAVSPDGTKIIFQVFRHGAWLLDLADGSMQRVLTDPTAEEFAWSSDGRRIAFPQPPRRPVGHLRPVGQLASPGSRKTGYGYDIGVRIE